VITRTGGPISGLFDGIASTPLGRSIATGVVMPEIAKANCRPKGQLTQGGLKLVQSCDPCGCDSLCDGHNYADNFFYNTCNADQACYTAGVFWDWANPYVNGYKFVNWECDGMCCTQTQTCRNPD
jgi:hypothetical protein